MNSIVDKLLEKTTATSAGPAHEWSEYCDIAELVEFIRLQQQQQGVGRSALVGQTNFEGFKAWASKNGAKFDKVDIGPAGNSGNGILAKEAITKEETVLEVPLSMMMSTETAKKTKIGQFAETDKVLKVMPNVMLALHLLVELHNKDSFWREYINILPKHFNTPLYWTSDELLLLKGTSKFSAALTLHKNIARQFAYLFNNFKNPKYAEVLGFSGKEFSYDDYRWAVSVVMTRQNQIPVGGTDEAPVFALALIPLYDMINHAPGETTTFHDSSEQATKYKAMDSYQSGDELQMHYGGRCNGDLLLNCGFIDLEHRNDFMAIKLGISKSDPLYKRKGQLLINLTIAPVGDFIIEVSGQPDPQLIAFCRVANLDEASLADLFANPDKCAALGEPNTVAVSMENDLLAWRFIETRCKLLLLSLPGSEEEDNASISSATYNGRNALILRSMERMILKRALKHAEDKRTQLSHQTIG